MYTELMNTLKELKCPNCGVLGSMNIQQAQAYIQCSACNQTHLDPFEIGPWESRILEHVGGEVVAAYTVTTALPETDKEIDEAYADFVKFLFPDAASRRVVDESRLEVSKGE